MNKKAVRLNGCTIPPNLRQRLGAAAREKALAEFDERIVIERTMGVYRELLG